MMWILEVKISNNVDIVLVNDGSKDKTKEALKNFMGDIVYLENKKNKGILFDLFERFF